MKIIVVDKYKNETLMCESVSEYHGRLIVSLMNGNFSSKNRKEEYKLVNMDYEIEYILTN